MERDWLRARSCAGIGSRFVGRLWRPFRYGSIGVYAERSLGAGIGTALTYESWWCHTEVHTLVVSQIRSKAATIFPFKARCDFASIAGFACCSIVTLNNIALRHPRLRDVCFKRHELTFPYAIPEPIGGNRRYSMLVCKRWLGAALDYFLIDQNRSIEGQVFAIFCP